MVAVRKEPIHDQNHCNLKLTVFFVVSVLEMVLFASPFLGWAALVLVLKQEGIFYDLCQTTSVNSTWADRGDSSNHAFLGNGCVEQDTMLNLAFTLATSIAGGMAFPVGLAVDRLGAKSTRIVSSCGFVVASSLLVLTSRDIPTLFFPAFIILAISASSIPCTTLKVALVFGKWRSTATSVFTGALISSAALFLIFKVLYEHGVAFRSLCYGLLAASCYLVASSAFLFPNLDASKDKTDSQVNKKSPLEIDTRCVSMETVPLETTAKKLPVKPWLSNATSSVFIGSVFFVGLCRFRAWFFLGSFEQYMSGQPGANGNTAKKYANIFGVIQLFGVALGPLMGLVIEAGKRKRLPDVIAQDKTASAASTLMKEEKQVLSGKAKETSKRGSCACSRAQSDKDTAGQIRELRGCVASFTATAAILTVFGCLTLIPSMHLQILTFLVAAIFRTFYNAGVANLFLVSFPVEHFGKLCGLQTFINAIMQCLQYPIFILIESHLHGKVFWINAVFLLASLPLFGFPLHLNKSIRLLEASLDRKQNCITCRCIHDAKITPYMEIESVV